MIFGFFAVVGKSGVNVVVVIEGCTDESSEGDAFVGWSEDYVKGYFAVRVHSSNVGNENDT